MRQSAGSPPASTKRAETSSSSVGAPMPLLRRAKPPAGSLTSSPDSVIPTPLASTPWDPSPALPPSAETEVLPRGGRGAAARALRRCCASATTAAGSSSSASEAPATIVGSVPPRCEKAPSSAPGPCGRVGVALDDPDSHPGGHSLPPPRPPDHPWHAGGAVASPALLGGLTCGHLAAPVAAALGPGPTQQSYPSAPVNEPPCAAPVERRNTRR